MCLKISKILLIDVFVINTVKFSRILFVGYLLLRVIGCDFYLNDFLL